MLRQLYIVETHPPQSFTDVEERGSGGDDPDAVEGTVRGDEVELVSRGVVECSLTTFAVATAFQNSEHRLHHLCRHCVVHCAYRSHGDYAAGGDIDCHRAVGNVGRYLERHP